MTTLPSGEGRGCAVDAVERIASRSALAELREDWNRLSQASAAPNVFTTYEWYQAWIARLMADAGRGRLEPYVLVLRRGGKVVGIAPLVRRIAVRMGLRVRKIEFLTDHADYNDLVVGDNTEALTQAVMQYLARSVREWDLVDLMDSRSRGEVIPMQAATAQRAGLLCHCSDERECCPYLPIDAPWAEMRKRESLRFAHRAVAAFEKKARDGFRVRVADRPHLEPDLLERMIAVEAQKQVHGQVSAPVIGRYREVFQSLLDTLGPHGSVAVSLVEKGDELIAFGLLFRSGTKLWGHLTAFDRRFSSVSPGTVLFCAALDYGFCRRYDEFDLLRGTDAYKRRWTERFHQNQRMVLWNRSWRSRLAARLFLRLHKDFSPSTTP